MAVILYDLSKNLLQTMSGEKLIGMLVFFVLICEKAGHLPSIVYKINVIGIGLISTL